MTEPTPLFKWFPIAIEYATVIYLAIVVIFIFVKKLRKYDVIIPLLGLILTGASLFRLMAWGRTVVDEGRSLHYMAYIVGLLIIYQFYIKIKEKHFS